MKKTMRFILALTVMAGLVFSGGEKVASAQEEGAVLKVGVLAPLTGVFAGGGWLIAEGVKLAFEQVNNEVAGRPVQLFIEDTGARPDMAIQKTQRLVEREKVQLILGPLSGGEGMAMKEFGDKIPNVTVIVAGAAAEDITMRGIKDNVFRTSYSGAQVMFPFGKYAYENLGMKKIATIASDYAFPHSQIGGFLSTYLLAGGQVSARIWVPFGAPVDFSSYIAQIPKDIDGILVALGGTDAINFVKQFKEFGLLGKIPILGGSIFVDPVVLSQVGADLVGVRAGSHYAQELPYPEFKAFDKAFLERSGLPSSLWAADYFVATQVAIEALNAVNGKIEDQQAFREALRKVKMNTPRGPFEFDTFHNVVLTSYITEVKKIGDQFRNVVIESFPNQDQFGPFDPDWYQAQPPFGRTTPTLETLEKAVLR
jgi:branched-chain amino acid transport system substrate-binding protein